MALPLLLAARALLPMLCDWMAERPPHFQLLPADVCCPLLVKSVLSLAGSCRPLIGVLGSAVEDAAAPALLAPGAAADAVAAAAASPAAEVRPA